MSAILVCDICKKKICNYCSTDEASNTVKIGATYKDRIGSIDTCRDCREKIEDFIFKMMEENNESSN